MKAEITFAVAVLVVGCDMENQDYYKQQCSSLPTEVQSAFKLCPQLFLPLHHEVEDIELRTPVEVANRAVCLFSVISVADGKKPKKVVSWLKKYGIWDHVTPAEKEFLTDSSPTDRTIAMASWRLEALLTLLWCLGKAESLPPPGELGNLETVKLLCPGVKSDPSEFLSEPQLRHKKEILALLSITFQLNWHAVNARFHKQPMPDGLDSGVLYQRHYALNWIVQYCDEEWDDVSTDT